MGRDLVTRLRDRLPLAIWLAAIVAAAWVVLAATRVSTELTLFLPRGADALEETLIEQLRSPSSAQVLLIGVEGLPREALIQTSVALAQALRASGLYAYVSNGAASWSAREQALLFGHRYLLSPAVAAERFSEQALRESLQERLRTLVSPLGAMEKRLVPRDPTAELQQVLRLWTDPGSADGGEGVWLSADGKRALLLAQGQAPPFDLDAQAAAVSRIGAELARLPGAESARLLLSGPPVFSVRAREIISRDLLRLSIAAIVLVSLFLLAVYRAPTLLLLATLPLATGVLAGVAAVGSVYGTIHAITLAFGVTLIGVALDYPIHLFSHRSPEEPISETVRRIWPTLRLAVLTTALGYMAMLFSGFPGVAQLGLFAAVGLIAAAAVTRWVLPILTREAGASATRGWIDALSGRLDSLRRLRWPVPVLIAGGVAYLGALGHPVWETDLGNLSPISAEDRAIDRELRGAMGAPDVRKLIIVFGESAEAALQSSERVAARLEELVARGRLGGYEAPSRYLPSKRTQQRRQAALPSATELRARLRQAARDLPFREGLFEPFVADVGAAKAAAALEPAAFRDTPLELRLRSLLFPRENRWVAILPLREVGDDASLSRLVSALEEPGVHYVDLKESTNRLVNRYRDRVLPLLAAGAGAIMLALGLGLRSVGAVLRVLLPVAVAVVGAIVLLLASGQRLSMFHLVALLLVAGIGLDYGLFFNRAARDRREQERTASALLVCALTTLIVFGVLTFARVPVLTAIGSTVAAGVALCFVLAAAFSPRCVESGGTAAGTGGA